MRYLSRHVLLNILTVFLAGLMAMSLLMLFVVVVQEGVTNGLGLLAIARIVPYVVPMAMRISIPLAILLTVCIVYGRMAADNEIVALKSMGISPLAIMVPCWCLAFVVSLIAVYINDLAVSWGRMGMQRIVLESVEEIMYRMLRTQKSYHTPRFTITVLGVQGQTLVRPYVVLQPMGDQPELQLSARKAELRSDPQQNTFSIVVTEGWMIMGNQKAYFPNTQEIPIPLPDATRKGTNTSSPSQIPLWRIPQEIDLQMARIESMQQKFALDAATRLMTGDPGILQANYWQNTEGDLRGAQDRYHRLRTEPWRRWANGFSCLFFVLVGVPLAIILRSANFFTTFAACFFPILGIYYPLLAYGADRAKDGALPPIIVWLGNGVLLVIGLILLRRVMRY